MKSRDWPPRAGRFPRRSVDPPSPTVVGYLREILTMFIGDTRLGAEIMNPNNRRNFLKIASGAVAGASLLIRRAGAASAIETVRVGFVGLNGRGNDHITGFAALPNVEIAALCDVDENVLNRRVEEHKNLFKHPVKPYVDYREMLKDPDIDVISIATPNHWHALMGIWACQAGKDVYVEKPCSHNVFEGRQLVEAARKYNRVVQHGTQSRSCEALREGIELLREGYIGEVYYAKGLCYKWRDTIGRAPVSGVPQGVHYDLWTGPAPLKPFTQNRFHYNWHWQWDYGNGDIGNQGVHEMDVARWGLGVAFPTLIEAQGGHFMFDDDQETPNTMVATFKYPEQNKMLVFEVRHWMTNNELGEINEPPHVVGCLFLGSKGYMTTHGFNRGYQAYLGRDGQKGKGRRGGEDHYANFIQAVRARDRNLLNAEIEEGHISAALCHLANAAFRVQRALRFDPATQCVIGDPEADGIIQGKARAYRAPFTVPEEI